MKTYLLMSGGVDSTVLAVQLKMIERREVHAVAFDYGQRHQRELKAADKIAGVLDIPLTVIHLPFMATFLPGSSQTDEKVEVPEGHYTDETMKLTVVPNRNMVMLALAAAIAIANKAERLAYAAHAGDHAIYPDCRPAFIEALTKALDLCDWNPVKLEAPFAQRSKADIVRLGSAIAAPLGLTYSCYKGGRLHCGKCGTCVERREAFEQAGVTDPTSYEPCSG